MMPFCSFCGLSIETTTVTGGEESWDPHPGIGPSSLPPSLPPSVPLHERLVAPVVAPPTFNGDGSLARSIRTFGGEGGKVCPLLISLPAARVPSHPNSKVPTYPSRLVPWLKYPEDMTCPECVSIVSLVKYTSSMDRAPCVGRRRTRTDRVD